MDTCASESERQRVGEIAQEVLEHRTTIILEAVRKLYPLAHSDAIAEEDGRTLVIAMESETDDLPARTAVECSAAFEGNVGVGEEFRMSKSRKAVLTFICLAMPLAVWAADFWDTKPYQNWSAKETQRMMEDSPWAATVTVSGPWSNVVSVDPNTTRGYDPEMSYILQFRSALPIRKAQVRLQQLDLHYDGMTAEERAAFEANASKYLAATFPDRVLVSVTFRSSNQRKESGLPGYWTKQSTDKLRTKVFLNAGGEKLSLTNYSFKDDTFQFTFPRPKKLSTDGNISVEFPIPQLDRIHERRIVQGFDLKRMLVDGQPTL